MQPPLFPAEEPLEPYGDFSEGRALPAELRERFAALIWEHYRSRGRSLPWRETRDPYRILVSELMLQQTQTERVLPKYRAFVERFPDFVTLAAAPLSEVIALWQGLGYNRRAKALRECAERVIREHDGRLPERQELLRDFPGIGPYTAAALCAFAFEQPVILIETNVRRVYLHYFFRDRAEVRDAELLPLIEATLDRRDPRGWYYALMDFGVMLKAHLPNPNRRSAHYARQSPFENSNRQLRGLILRELSLGGPLASGELLGRLPFAAERVVGALGELEREGLLACEPGGRYRIADS